jgi:hypothetical protein
MNLKFLVSCLILLLFGAALNAQQFGGNPPSVRWKQINTDTFRIVFPAGLEQPAQQVANISNDLSRATTNSIGDRIRKINIVLQNQTTVSNGYVSLGPYRSEFQLTPDPNSFVLGSLPWIQSLAIHEYRHVQQYNNFRKGFASGFYILFGEEGQALANALTIPDWFFEGDAVYQETVVSNQGRGRLPYFFNGYRSLWSAGRNYSYMKLRNGSLRDFVPSHYPLGYFLVAYGRDKYGMDIWKKVTNDAAAWRGFFYPFQKAVKRHTGKTFKEFRQEALAFFDSIPSSASTPAKHFVADEEYPQWVDSSSVVYLKTTYKQIPCFVIRSNGKERKIRTRDLSIDNYFSYRNGRIVYTSFNPDIRWGWRDFSDLKLLNIHDGSQRTLTTNSKYFSPDISEDGNHVVAVHVDVNGNGELHLINASNGLLEKTIPNNDGLFYTNPKFYGQNKVVSAVRNREGKMSVVIIDYVSNTVQYILPFAWTVIGFPSTQGNSIYFTASYHGNDRIFRWKNDQLNILPETEPNSHHTGDYQPNALNDKLVWTRFTANGYQLMFATLDSNREKDLSTVKLLPDQSNFGIRSISDSLNEFLSEIPQTNYRVTDYSKSFRLFKFHSRRPYISDPDYSFSFVSENILNTLQSEISLNYNRNEKYTQLGFSALYGAWFPFLRVATQYTFDRNATIRTTSPKVYWNEWENSIGFSIPLNLTGGRTFTYLTASSDYVYNKRYFTGYYKDSFENRAFGYMNASLNFSNQIQQARQHIHPRFAQTVNLNYKKAITNLDGNQFLISGNLYLPGIFINHSLVLQAAWQERDTLNEVRFSNSFPFSRGYSTNNFHRMWKLGSNYHFPLVYPDWGFGNVVYFLRIRSNVFYDFTRVSDYNTANKLVSLDFRSYGTELFFDTKWWNQLPLSFGFRYSRLLDKDLEGRDANQFEFVLPVNLLSR